MDPSEQALLDAARAGDRASLEALLERVQPRVFRFGLKMCGRRDDAEEVLQETMLTMARSLRDFRGGAALSTWLYTIARSFCIKQRRRGKHEPAHVESLEAAPAAAQLPDPGLGPEASAESRQTETALLEAIGALEPMYREVLVLRDGEGLTAPEVADVLGLSVEAVKSRLHRARAQVRERLSALLGVHEQSPASGCPDVIALASQKLEGEIDRDVCAEMERHLAGCATCRERCDSLRDTLALCRRAGPPSLPAEVQRSVRQALRGLVDAR